MTGASQGIGRALALECARRGARVSVCARSDEALTAVAAEVAGVGGVIDICDEHAVTTWLHAATSQSGPIDVLVNNAGMLGPKATLAEYPLDAWREVFEVNAVGTFVVTQAALPHMTRPGGIMAHVSSYLGRFALPRYGAYCASKFAVEGLARLVAEEHRDEGLISVAIDPGMVGTEMLKAAQESDDVSGAPTPAEAAIAFADLLERLGPDDTASTQSIFPQ